MTVQFSEDVSAIYDHDETHWQPVIVAGEMVPVTGVGLLAPDSVEVDMDGGSLPGGIIQAGDTADLSAAQAFPTVPGWTGSPTRVLEP